MESSRSTKATSEEIPPERSVTQIIALSLEQPGLLDELEKFRRNIVVMFTDISGSTAYFERHGDVAGLMMVHRCHEVFRQIVEEHAGRMVKTIGDAILALFENGRQSILAAVAMQKTMTRMVQENKFGIDPIAIRVGLNYGTGIVKSNDVFGDAVNVASRVESAAQPGQILLSASLQKLLGDWRTLPIEAAGKFSLKGKSGEQELFKVLWNPELEPLPLQPAILPKSHPVASHPRRIQHIHDDGTSGSTYEVRGGPLTVGRSRAEVNFPSDASLSPLHAKFTLHHQELLLEDMSEGSGVFTSLSGITPLQDRDVVLMGKQALQFRVKEDALSAAAATGTSISRLADILRAPVAEFVRIRGLEDPEQSFPLIEEECTWGRTKADFVFPEDDFMSRTHAKVYRRGEDFFIEDLGSRNGTFLKLRSKTAVPAGTMVRIGGQFFRALE